jgi:DNA (cytosine-5)-methyltransferase 1
MLKNSTLTYISLFSSAGVGCYGFHIEGYRCIATNELLPRRLDVQRANHKCEYDTGYIDGDITSAEIKQRIYDEVDRWGKKEMIVLTCLLQLLPAKG